MYFRIVLNVLIFLHAGDIDFMGIIRDALQMKIFKILIAFDSSKILEPILESLFFFDD